MTRIAVLVSGGGTNLQALLDAQQRGELADGEIVCVVSSKPNVYALERAKQAGVPTTVLTRQSFPDHDAYDAALLQILLNNQVDIIVLAGFLSIIGSRVLQHYKRRILNVHPSLIPSFCGPGFYGLRVHQAVLDYGVKVTGATVHYVTDVVDGGEILLQKAVPVYQDDTPESLQKRVMEQAEWELLPQAVAMVCKHRLEIGGN